MLDNNEINTLKNILILEKKLKCSDRSVIGGFHKYFNKWALCNIDKVENNLLKARLLELTTLGDYYLEWDGKSREQWIHNVSKWLTDYGKIMNLLNTNSRGVNNTKGFNISGKKKNSVTSLDCSITSIKGINNITATKLSKLEIKTVRDLIYYFPRYHLDYSNISKIANLPVDNSDGFESEPTTIIGNIWDIKQVVTTKKNLKSTEIVIGDDTGNVKAIWYNQPYMAKVLNKVANVVISGKYKVYKGCITFQSPDWDILDKSLIHAGRLVPVYGLTKGLYQRQIRNLIKRALDSWINRIDDYMPEDIKKQYDLIDLKEALYNIHFPEDMRIKTKAVKRLAFDELFILHLGLLSRKANWQKNYSNKKILLHHELVHSLINALPFSLTNAQQKVLSDILADIKSGIAMSRLIQGDVGSGKTVIALLSILLAVYSGYQSVIMAPTSILAEQHYRTISNFLQYLSKSQSLISVLKKLALVSPENICVELLTGKIAEKNRYEIYEGLKNGKVNICVGTHALIQESVEFNNLGLVVIDEQHRFGVLQRNKLRQKGYNPHVLVMTATPIPRTLALTIYGDLDISILDEMPPGRQIVKTRWLTSEQRNKAYEFIARQVEMGNQAFIICPLIEESVEIEAKAATIEYKKLSESVFPKYKLGLLHGRMSPEEKENIMKDFMSRKYDILVSTPVIEVGIDIPNATVILIEAAERFGLSQLHQLRGRVGRGDKQSYCILISEKLTSEGIKRLRLIEDIHDGFVLAEKDMELRGPGEFLGTRQSGIFRLKVAKFTDVDILESVREAAKKILAKDPNLALQENKSLLDEISRIFSTEAEWS